MINIEEINLDELFGKDRAQEDKNLEKYFIKTQYYDDIISGNKELVLGRKGSGKSSLFSILSQELSKQGSVIKVSPKGEDYIQIKENVSQLSDISLDEDFKYALVWKDYILTELSLSIIKNHDTPELKKYLKSQNKLDDSFVLKFTKSILKVFGDSSLKAKAGDMEVGFNIDFSGLFSLTDSSDLEKVKAEITETITENMFFVLFDNLDEPWKNTPEMNSWLRGLILSMRQLKRDFQNLKLICFLRNDIFDQISQGSDLFDAKNEIIRLNWKDDQYYSLQKMISTRIAVYLKRDKPNTLREFNYLWCELFPIRVPLKNRDVYTINYIIDRTFARPRELIQFCRLALEKSNSKVCPIPYESIFSAARDFSDWKLIDLVGEYSKTYKNIDKCILSLAGIPARDWSISYKKLDEHFNTLNDDERIYNLVTNTYLQNHEIIELLYKSGFLRQKRRNRFLTYEDESYFNKRIVIFDIHHAFRNKLFT